MLGKILSLFASVILLVGCSSNAPDIRAICLRDDIGNYVIKWETDPVMEGIVKMTVSDNPDLFTNESPIIYAILLMINTHGSSGHARRLWIAYRISGI